MNVQPRCFGREVKADGSPVAEPVPFDEKHRRAAGFTTGANRKCLEHFAKRIRLVQGAHRSRQPSRLRGSLILVTQLTRQSVYFPPRCFCFATPRLDVAQCRLDIVPRRVELDSGLVEFLCDRPDVLASGRRFLLTVFEVALTFVEAALQFVNAPLGLFTRFIQTTVERFELFCKACPLFVRLSRSCIAEFAELMLGITSGLSRGGSCGVGRDLSARVLGCPDQLVLTRAELRFKLAPE